MKAVLLAGGYGTRLSEETTVRPKPMVEIGDMPILWHIMKGYYAHGIKEFIVCCGYKGFVIKEYFANYRLHMSDVTFDAKTGDVQIHDSMAEDWKVTLVDTGLSSMTGGRLRRVAQYLDDETFCMTYGDGVSDVNISELIQFHRDEGRHATLCAVQPPGRFGAMSLNDEDTAVKHFREKPETGNAWINAGFFVLEPEVLNYISEDKTVWEREPLEQLAGDGQLSSYCHKGFWSPMDTLQDRMVLEELWKSGDAPWKQW